MAYFVLAGGFASVLEKMSGRRMELTPDERVVDFIIKIDGLPKEFFRPLEIVEVKEYYCSKCNRNVPEAEIEAKMGCWNHNPTMTRKVVEKWNTSVFEKYEIKTMKYLAPMYRIWVNNPEGEDTWRRISKYMQNNYPAHKALADPVPVGNRMQWLVDIESIPYVDIELGKDEIEVAEQVIKANTISVPTVSVAQPTATQTPVQAPAQTSEADKRITKNARGMCECSTCGKEFKDYRSLSSHVRAAHDGVIKNYYELKRAKEAAEEAKALESKAQEPA